MKTTYNEPIMQLGKYIADLHNKKRGTFILGISKLSVDEL